MHKNSHLKVIKAICNVMWMLVFGLSIIVNVVSEREELSEVIYT